MKNKYPVTAKRLAQAMSDANMKAIELSERSGVSQSLLSQYLSGMHSPSNISGTKLAKILNVSPIWLMGLDTVEIEIVDKNDVRKKRSERLESFCDSFSRLSDSQQDAVLLIIDSMLKGRDNG